MDPLAVANPIEPPLRQSAGAGSPTGLSVLLVEDDDVDAFLICDALSRNPAVRLVTWAHNGQDAISFVNSGGLCPDLAFVDLHMPKMSGFDLLIALANGPRARFPMVVLTSSSAPNDALRSQLRGAATTLSKPVASKDLYGMLKATIDSIFPSVPTDEQSQPPASDPVPEGGRPRPPLVEFSPYSPEMHPARP
jgi:CheY-like chemotaxis protein